MDKNVQIELLRKDLNSLIEKNKKLSEDIADMKDLLAKHNHTDHDGTARIRSTVEISRGEYLGVGDVCGIGSEITTDISGRKLDNIGILIGNDRDVTQGVYNSQLIVQRYIDTHECFFNGTVEPTYFGYDGKVTSGENKLRTNENEFVVDELVGAMIFIINGNTNSTETFIVTSNTKNSITLDSSVTFSSGASYYFVTNNMYLGSGTIPWRRVYTLEGTGGGLRFGFGPTNAGDNGLLYMDSVGDLYWRNKSGTSVKLN